MSDCIFLVADGTMKSVFEGFLLREKFHLSLRCKAFDFDVKTGISDPNMYRQAHVLLHPFQKTHKHAVVVLDNDWKGSPGVDQIRSYIANLLNVNGWSTNRFEVVVIDPELENWIWQESQHVVDAFNYREQVSLRQWLQERDMWASDAAKPARPKEAVEAVLRMTRVPRSAATYRKIVERVSISGCTDPAFMQLSEALRRWFPAGEQY